MAFFGPFSGLRVVYV